MATAAFHPFLTPILTHNRAAPERQDVLQQASAVSAITARARGAGTQLVGLAQLEEFQALIARRKLGPRRCADLREQRIGLPTRDLESGAPHVDALRAATAILKSEGLYYHEIDWVELAPREETALPPAYSTEIAALDEGWVDAVYVRGPAGLEAARAADVRVLADISAHRDPQLKLHAALLRAVLVDESLLRQHPDVIARELLERWPLLPARMNLDEAAIGALEALKIFMLQWEFIRTDFQISDWTGCDAPTRAAWSDSRAVAPMCRCSNC